MFNATMKWLLCTLLVRLAPIRKLAFSSLHLFASPTKRSGQGWNTWYSVVPPIVMQFGKPIFLLFWLNRLTFCQHKRSHASLVNSARLDFELKIGSSSLVLSRRVVSFDKKLCSVLSLSIQLYKWVRENR